MGGVGEVGGVEGGFCEINLLSPRRVALSAQQPLLSAPNAAEKTAIAHPASLALGRGPRDLPIRARGWEEVGEWAWG